GRSLPGCSLACHQGYWEAGGKRAGISIGRLYRLVVPGTEDRGLQAQRWFRDLRMIARFRTLGLQVDHGLGSHKVSMPLDVPISDDAKTFALS
ncbi:MAG: hypothetical protein ACWGPS_08935, partial [Candidatus Promineifilaceae bacterium]